MVAENTEAEFEVKRTFGERLSDHLANFGGSWSKYAQSGWQNAMANKSTAASGLSNRTWSAPDPNPTGWFKARIVMRWKNAGGVVVGKRIVEYDYYSRKWSSSTTSSMDYCLQDW